MNTSNTHAALAQQHAEIEGFETLIREQLSTSHGSDSGHTNLLESKLAKLSAFRSALASGIPVQLSAIQASMAGMVSLLTTALLIAITAARASIIIIASARLI